MTAADLLRSVGDALIAVTIAPRCAACATVLAHPLRGRICASCWLAIPRLLPAWCRVCGGMLASWRTISINVQVCPACRRRPGFVDAGRAVGAYEGSLRDIIHAFKYEGRRSIGTRLGVLLRTAGTDLVSDARCAIPVPLHAWRRVRRGFNQAADLARALDVPVVHALWRSRATTPQTGLTAAARRGNVRGAFTMTPVLRRRIDSYVAGQIVILVDDVWTNGATLDECARVLKEAGAKEVRALTVARADVRSVRLQPDRIK
jgi:ComF family protein